MGSKIHILSDGGGGRGERGRNARAARASNIGVGEEEDDCVENSERIM